METGKDWNECSTFVVCHIHLHKLYHARGTSPESKHNSSMVPVVPLPAEGNVIPSKYSPKVDGLHLCRNCMSSVKVNVVIKPDLFPLHRMEDYVDCIGTAKFTSKLDLLKGYWQVPLSPRTSEISDFATTEIFLEYPVMVFWLRNAPSTFQCLMNRVLGRS